MAGSEKTGFERISALFDAGTFVELGALVKREGDYDGVICGYGAVNGKLAYAFLQDDTRNKGAFDSLGAKKIHWLYEMAVSNSAPVIGVFNSVGAVIYDGTDAMSAYGTLLSEIGNASGVVTQIAVVTGVCSGLMAAAAALMDFTVLAKDNASLYVVSPFLAGKETGTADSVSSEGLASKICENETEAFAFARQLTAMLPSHNSDCGSDATGDDCNREIDPAGKTGADLIREIADNADFTPLFDGYAAEMITGFAYVGGILTGIIANDPSVKGGALTPAGARKAAKMVRYCDAFRIPILTLTDSTGAEIDKAHESAPFAADLARLAKAYATAVTPKVTVYVGKAFAAGFVLMGSRALGADVVLALPSATFGILSPEASVAFVEQDRLNSGESREELVRNWTEQQAGAGVAASHGDIDDIIEPVQLRQRICSALYMTAEKGRAKDSFRHSGEPL